ncbi:J domain-containing protein required for chloroplast accumulation response 1 isoform X2 [Malania oleifera]|nr:J domain-containing protein required for chloroplast accumulation response 1 isoform X2 [Malania oleifera]
MRFSFSETTGSYGNEESNSNRRPWSGLSEKPVFGEETGNRRRYLSRDFFDDIYRGDESVSSTPKKVADRDPFSSAPGSRILSPAHPLRPQAEPFGGIPLPAKFSLPAKSPKGMDCRPFASLNHSPYRSNDISSNLIGYTYSSSTSPSRLSGQAIQSQDESRNGVWPFFHQSPLSHEFSLSSEESSKITKQDKTNAPGNSKRDSGSSEVSINACQFHFSIYRWASRGVPLLTPLRGGWGSRLKEKGRIERCSSSNGRVESHLTFSKLSTGHAHDIGFHSPNNTASANTEFVWMGSEMQDNDSFPEKNINMSAESRVEPCQIVEEAVLPTHEPKTLKRLQNTVENVSGNIVHHYTSKESESYSVSEIDLCEKEVKEVAAVKLEVWKPELKPLRSLFNEENNEQGDDGKARKVREKENMIKAAMKLSASDDIGKNVKKQDGERIVSNGQVDEISIQSSPPKSKDSHGRNKLKGKVGDFVKIFNQEASSKSKINFDSHSHSFRWKNRDNFGAEKEKSFSSSGFDEKKQNQSACQKKPLPDTSIVEDEKFEQMEKQHSGINAVIDKFSDTTCEQWKDLASVPDESASKVGNMDKSFQENFLMLSQDENKLPQTGEDHEEIEVSDTRVQKWSSGREGNIRSLLSTLQFVLWPESGWKPVPLVDIIEGNAVKRAYQKALLCLHPDKLQQKGAASHQKYIAEKVFDVLQEAWTHFGSLSSV